MTESIEKDQLENICSSLLRGFIEWIDINDGPEKAIILDSAYQFKLLMLKQENETLQKKIFSFISKPFKRRANNPFRTMERNIYTIDKFRFRPCIKRFL